MVQDGADVGEVGDPVALSLEDAGDLGLDMLVEVVLGRDVAGQPCGVGAA